ncbi:MAG: glycosyltransferase family 2 protein [Candidatus Kapabacteria bacterium]|nr:glycosyltransferase family 2 protein [Candidatus Kapabacteria bacterium]
MTLPLSVAYISFNEEHIIESSINSIKSLASQIIVVDSFSSDRTVEIARNLGAEVFSEEWKGFVAQKNSALNKCSQDWILLLDCDEIVSPLLLQEISEVVKSNKPAAYSINRRTVYLGKKMNHSWQPDRVTRLVHKSLYPQFTGGKVHEKLEHSAKEVNNLKHEILHYSYKDISNHFEKTVQYAKLSAETYFEKGTKAGICNLIINPLFAFVNMYFFKLGFLDGWRGLIAAYSSMTGTFLKYAELKNLQELNKKG